MNNRFKEAIQQGNLIEAKIILSSNSQSRCELIAAINEDDLRILKEHEQNPQWEFAGYGSNLMPDDSNYRYRMDVDDKYVIRYSRIPAIGSYFNCLQIINNIRGTLKLSSLDLPEEKPNFIYASPHGEVCEPKNTKPAKPVDDLFSSVNHKKTSDNVKRELNFWHKSALKDLRLHGLTQEMLMNRNDSGHEFNENHCFALRNLVLDRSFSIGQALDEIDGLSSEQVGGIHEGLLREDVIMLNNFWHVKALEKLKERGLTAEMLLNRNDSGHEFDENHCFALRNLVLDRSFSIGQAIDEIDGLSSEQARGISNGLSREDVIMLNNFWHVSALEELKEHGLTVKMLLNRNENGHEFDCNHYDSLRNLVKKRHLTIEQALEKIDGLSKDQAWVAQKGLNLADVPNLSGLISNSITRTVKSNPIPQEVNKIMTPRQKK